MENTLSSNNPPYDCDMNNPKNQQVLGKISNVVRRM